MSIIRSCRLVLGALASLLVACSGEGAAGDDGTEVSDLTEYPPEVQITYGAAYAHGKGTMTFAAAPDAPTSCARTVERIGDDEEGAYPEIRKLKFAIPRGSGCRYAVASLKLEFTCLPSARPTCDGQPSTTDIAFGDPEGVDFEQWRLGAVMGTDGRSRQGVLVVPLDVHASTLSFSSPFDLRRILYLSLREGY